MSRIRLDAVDDAALERALEVALLRARQRVVEDDEVGVGLDAARGDLVDLAAAGEERGVGRARAAPVTMPATSAPADSASAFSSASRSAGSPSPKSSSTSSARSPPCGRSNMRGVDGCRTARRRGRARTRRCGGRRIRPAVAVKLRGRCPACGIVTARAGTTVEIACLYTICVTVFLSRTTYWSNDSICPCSLMPLTR